MRGAALLRGRWLAAVVGLLLGGAVACTQPASTPSVSTADQRLVQGASDSSYPSGPFARIETGMHTAPINRIDVDAAERFLVSGSDDKTVRVWDLASGALAQTLRLPIDEGDVGKVYAVAISPDGATIAAGGFTGQPGATESIYLFDRRSGGLRHRIAGLEDAVYHLAFSHDGTRLAAALGGSGVRVYETAGWTEMLADRDYNDDSYSADFAADGRMVTTSPEGFIRLYGRDLKLAAKQPAPGGRQPFFARFSPDGTRIAVGYADTTRVDVLAAGDLSLLFAADIRGVNESPAIVAWSEDGRFLYAGGKYMAGDGGLPIRRWAEAGRGAFVDLPVATNTIMGVKPLHGGRLAVGAADPLLAVLDAGGAPLWRQIGETADFRDQHGQFGVSADGETIRFGFEHWGERPAVFSFRDLALTAEAPADPALKAALTETAAFAVTDWKNDVKPRLNGAPLPLGRYETARSLAIAPSGDRFLLGAEWSLRLFDRRAEEIWRVAAPGVAWGVNISGDGRFALGAFADGSIRWYDMADGRELLAFFPHKDGKRWVAWTPEGFFAAAEGGKDLVGYQLNRGADQVPEFISVDRLYDAFYRPDLLVARLQGDEAKIREALARIGDVGTVLAAGLPPQVELVGPASDRAAAGRYRHQVRITDRGGGIGRIEIRINGVVVEGERAGLPARAGPGPEMQADVDLVDDSTIETTVYDAANKIASRTVVREVAVEKPRQRERPKLYGVIVGIDRYRDADFALRYAAGDAAAIKRTLETRARPLFTSVDGLHLLADPLGETGEPQATKAGITAAFQAVAQQAEPQDVFVIYLAGHGLAEDGTYYFLPQDLVYRNHEALVKGSLSKAEIETLVLSVKAQKKLILIDTCQAGALLENQQLAFNVAGNSRGGGEVEMKTAIDRLMRATGGASIAASTSAQRAREGYGSGANTHGVFTYAVLEALEGAADVPEPDTRRPDGYVAINEIAAYVDKMVPIYSQQKWRREQFPIGNTMGQSFPIAVVP